MPGDCACHITSGVTPGPILAGAGQERRVQVEREAEETLAQARAEADRVAAETEERRGQVAREEDGIRLRAQEAKRLVTDVLPPAEQASARVRFEAGIDDCNPPTVRR